MPLQVQLPIKLRCLCDANFLFAKSVIDLHDGYTLPRICLFHWLALCIRVYVPQPIYMQFVLIYEQLKRVNWSCGYQELTAGRYTNAESIRSKIVKSFRFTERTHEPFADIPTVSFLEKNSCTPNPIKNELQVTIIAFFTLEKVNVDQAIRH